MVNKKVFKRKRLLFKKLCSQKLEIVLCSVFMFFSDGYKSNFYSGVYASESIQTFPVVLELKSHPGENVKNGQMRKKCQDLLWEDFGGYR